MRLGGGDEIERGEPCPGGRAAPRSVYACVRAAAIGPLAAPVHGAAHPPPCTPPPPPDDPPPHRTNPRRQLTLGLVRDGKPLELPITPAEVPDGSGRIGVQLAANAKLVQRRAGDPGAALVIGAQHFASMLGVITNGGRRGG